MTHPPYSSHSRPDSSLSAVRINKTRIEPLQRETHVLDLFIALKVSEDALFPPLYALRMMDLLDIEPCNRLEDLIRDFTGHENALLTCPPTMICRVFYDGDREYCKSEYEYESTPCYPGTISFRELSISFAPKEVQSVLPLSYVVHLTRSKYE
ncbi:hypothetical protein EDB19DRAFT_1632648 [Suillus lakei]|nr:hypothetical protein EDB19DRAFT_1632648 [Suillus lakei]